MLGLTVLLTLLATADEAIRIAMCFAAVHESGVGMSRERGPCPPERLLRTAQRNKGVSRKSTRSYPISEVECASQQDDQVTLLN